MVGGEVEVFVVVGGVHNIDEHSAYLVVVVGCGVWGVMVVGV